MCELVHQYPTLCNGIIVFFYTPATHTPTVGPLLFCADSARQSIRQAGASVLRTVHLVYAVVHADEDSRVRSMVFGNPFLGKAFPLCREHGMSSCPSVLLSLASADLSLAACGSFGLKPFGKPGALSADDVEYTQQRDKQYEAECRAAVEWNVELADAFMHATTVLEVVGAGAKCDYRAGVLRETPLMLAASVGNAAVAVMLLKAGADPEIERWVCGQVGAVICVICDFCFAVQQGGIKLCTSHRLVWCICVKVKTCLDRTQQLHMGLWLLISLGCSLDSSAAMLRQRAPADVPLRLRHCEPWPTMCTSHLLSLCVCVCDLSCRRPDGARALEIAADAGHPTVGWALLCYGAQALPQWKVSGRQQQLLLDAPTHLRHELLVFHAIQCEHHPW